ncbi:ABC transporter G family member, partial [Musa troglodytarum]
RQFAVWRGFHSNQPVLQERFEDPGAVHREGDPIHRSWVRPRNNLHKRKQPPSQGGFLRFQPHLSSVVHERRLAHLLAGEKDPAEGDLERGLQGLLLCHSQCACLPAFSSSSRTPIRHSSVLVGGAEKEMDKFLYFSLVIWLVMLMANSFVACFSALVPTFIMGNSVISGLMGSFFLFSGYFIAKDNIPRYWIFMHYLSFFKYPFEAFVLNEYGGARGRRECLEWEGKMCALDGGMFLREQGVVESQRWSHVGVMLGFICGYRILCFLILRLRCYDMRR